MNKITNLKPSKNIKNEVYFDSEDELSAEKEIERLIVKKQENVIIFITVDSTAS